MLAMLILFLFKILCGNTLKLLSQSKNKPSGNPMHIDISIPESLPILPALAGYSLLK